MLIMLAESRHRRCKLLRHPAYAGLTLGTIDKRNVDMFKILDRRIVNDRRGIGGVWCDKGEKENCGYGSARQVQTD
jgi:hypothetical protein